MSEVVSTPAQETPKADQAAAAPQTPNAQETPKAPEAKGEKPAAEAPKGESADGKKGEVPAAAGKPEEKSGDKAANDKAEKPSGEKAVPEKYELKLPEGSLLKPEALEKVAQYAKEHKLSNEQAQAILNRENEAVTSFAKEFDAKVKQEVDGWKNEAQGDKEIGGDRLNENVELANRVVKRFGSEAFIQKLNETGLGNHPELIRVFARIGKVMDDDKLILSGTGNVNAGKSAAEILYGNSSKK